MTAGGEEIGHFRLSFACGGKDVFNATYRETRRVPENSAILLRGVGLGVGELKTGVTLRIESSLRDLHAPLIETVAGGLALFRSSPSSFATVASALWW